MKEHDLCFSDVFNQLGITYSRYSDDLQLSGNGKPKWEYIKFIKLVLGDIGLKVNEKKIRFMFKNQRQEVLGITVNDKLSIDRHIRSQLKFRAKRDMLNQTDIGRIAYIKGVMR